MASFLHHAPCPACGSQDNVSVFADGSERCFGAGCDYYKPAGEPTGDHRPAPAAARPSDLLEYSELDGAPSRGLYADTLRKMRAGWGTAGGQTVLVFEYTNALGQPVAQKVRTADKRFSWRGDPKAAGLFGQQLWRGGPGDDRNSRVIVVEGEIDALTVFQAMGQKWPVVSIPNGAPAARKDLAKQLEWLESFDEIVLCLDNDPAGDEVLEECAELFSPGKVKVARLALKDPNEMLKAGRTEELVKALWQARSYRPDSIVSGVELIEKILETPEEGTPYPWRFLTGPTYGQRRGEMVVWAAGSGCGKSTVMRHIIHSLHCEHGEAVGVIALEETVVAAARAQVSIALGKRLHVPDIRKSVGEEQIRSAAERVLERVYLYDHWGSVEASAIIPKIRFMAKSLGVRWVVLDHLSIMVSGFATQGDERKRIDELVTKLRTAVGELDIGLHLVSHLVKSDGIPFEEGGHIGLDHLRGSGSIKQLSDFVIALERNQAAEGDLRDVIQVVGRKDRFTGDALGVLGALRYDRNTGLLTPTEVPEGGLRLRKSNGNGASFAGQPAGDF